jgi:DNA-directed RNA polymerase specialized sigma24 family protein
LLSALFQLHRERLKQLVISRLAGRFKHRFDASDVIQEASERLLDSITSPSQAANRSERILQVRRALEHTSA